LNAIFSQWCGSHTLDDVLAAFAAEEGTLAPIYAIDQIAADPQSRAREMITRVPDRDFGSVAMANVVPRFTVDRTQLRNSAGDVGQDNLDIYARWLGLSEQDIERLARQGVI
jgi:crotonobetainyl-CoA:carnitine CoA-transferase CaiB-like acyl-CoA transferase